MIRRVGPTAPIQWFISAINVGAGHARALLGGTYLLLITAMVAVMLVGAVVGMFLDGGNADPSLDTAKMAKALLPMLVFAAAVPAFVIAGIATLVHNAQRNAPTRATDAFAALRGRTALHLLLLVVVPLGSLWLNGLLTDAFAGPGYREAQQAAMAEVLKSGNVEALNRLPQPQNAGLLMLLTMALNLLTYALQVLAPIAVVIGGRTAWNALGEALGALVRNPLAALLGGVLAIVYLIAVLLASLLLMVVVALLGTALGKVGLLLSLLLALGFVTVAGLLWVAWGYFGWREMLSDEGTPPPMPGSAPDQFAA